LLTRGPPPTLTSLGDILAHLIHEPWKKFDRLCRRERKGTVLKGDAARGREVFFQSKAACAQDPVAVDERLIVEAVAREPEIVTPTAVAVDARGRIWVIARLVTAGD
jgi:hypothetical protein